MDQAEFKKKLMEKAEKALAEQFDEDEEASFTDFWEAVRDGVDADADDEDIDDSEDEDGDEEVDDEG